MPYEITEVEERGDVHLCEPWRHEEFNDWKINIKETDQEDSEVIKELDWEETHRKWDEDYYCWTIDLEAFFTAMNHFTENGYEVTFDQDAFAAYGRNMANNQQEDEI